MRIGCDTGYSKVAWASRPWIHERARSCHALATRRVSQVPTNPSLTRLVALVKSLLGKGGKTDFQVRQWGIRRTWKSVVPLNPQAVTGSGYQIITYPRESASFAEQKATRVAFSVSPPRRCRLTLRTARPIHGQYVSSTTRTAERARSSPPCPIPNLYALLRVRLPIGPIADRS